jgi:hypothetical protein
MKKILIATTALTVISVPASAVTLTFDRADACVGSCSAVDDEKIPSGLIRQSYGDTAFMDVSYATLSDFGNSSVFGAYAQYWDFAYGDLTDVANSDFVAATSILQIKFAALNGASLKLNSFDAAGWPNTSYNSTVKFYDLGYNLLDSFDFVAPGTGHYTFSSPRTFVGGFILQIGPDGYNVGIDNIDITSAVPEPASWAMLIAGFGLAGAAMRRRRVTVAVA